MDFYLLADLQIVSPKVIIGAAFPVLSDVQRIKSAVRHSRSFPEGLPPGSLGAVRLRAGMGPGLCLRTEMTCASLEAVGAQVCPGGIEIADAGGKLEESITPQLCGRARGRPTQRLG